MEENKVPAEDAKPEKCQMEVQDSHGHEQPLKNFPDAHPELEKAEVEKQENNSESERILGDVDMEAAITTDDVERAGGLGATDDISSLLPVAMDSTDFEASLRDAREFEEPQSQISRPGLGWREPGGVD